MSTPLRLTTLSLGFFSSLLGATPQDRNQGDLPRGIPDASTIRIDPVWHETGRLVVKLAEGTDAAAQAAVRERLAGRRMQPFFRGLERELRELRRRVQAHTPDGQPLPADLSLYFEVWIRGLADGRQLMRALNAMPQVEIAYPRERPTPPPGGMRLGDILPRTPNYTKSQGYALGAPKGIGGGAIRQLAGGWGTDVRVLDIEWGWWFDHEDLAALRPGSLVGPPSSRSSFNNHGTAVAGELVGDPDEWGVTGLTPDIRFLVATDFPASGYSVARAILTGMMALRKGDVMLLEAQTGTPLGLGPTEWNQADFDAIQSATRAGVIVVEAAGNGGVNLEDPRLGRRFDRSFRDSGAILVGATVGEALVPAGFSCYGDRIDANGWGGSVTTTGYGALFNPNNDRRQRYTNSFSGTSSASPIVTAAVVGILGAARAQLSAVATAKFDYKEVRRLLRTVGTPVPGSRKIGRRPDMVKILKAAGLERGLRIWGRAVLGQTHRIEVTPAFAGTAQDQWLLFGAPKTANVRFPVGPAPCDRLLLDPATAMLLANGDFRAGVGTVSVPVPNDPQFIGRRFYWQAATLRAATNAVCLTNSSMAFGER